MSCIITFVSPIYFIQQ